MSYMWYKNIDVNFQIKLIKKYWTNDLIAVILKFSFLRANIKLSKKFPISYPIVHVLVMWKKRSQRSFESKEMFDQALKFMALFNLLSWVNMNIDGGSLSLINFIDLLWSLWRGIFCLVAPSFFALPFGILCTWPMFFGALFVRCCWYIFFCFPIRKEKKKIKFTDNWMEKNSLEFQICLILIGVFRKSIWHDW